MSTALTWVHWAALSALFAALTAIFAKLGVESVSSDLATLLRTLVVVVVLAAFVRVTNQWTNPLALPPRTLFFLFLSALATGASWVCYFRALQIGNVSLVAPVDKLSVVLVAIFGTIFLGERLTMRDWAGVLLIASGALVLASRK